MAGKANLKKYLAIDGKWQFVPPSRSTANLVLMLCLSMERLSRAPTGSSISNTERMAEGYNAPVIDKKGINA